MIWSSEFVINNIWLDSAVGKKEIKREGQEKYRKKYRGKGNGER